MGDDTGKKNTAASEASHPAKDKKHGHAAKPQPAILAGLSKADLKAVQECHQSFGTHAYKEPPQEEPSEGVPQSKKAAAFRAQVNKIEKIGDPSIYTPANYEAQLTRAKEYTDVYVNTLKFPEGSDVARQRAALKQKFHAIIDGAAGMETGWSPDVVKNSAARPHSGVYQTQWSYIKEAGNVFDEKKHPALHEALQPHPEDGAILNLAKHAPKGAPTTSFAGQGAAFAGMAIESYENFLDRGGKPEQFSGTVVYQDHLLGQGGAHKFRGALEDDPDKKGHPGIGKPAYYGNYLITKHPFAGLNDLNPERLVYSAASPKDVDRMLRDKFVFAYTRLEKEGASAERLKGFQDAFLPEWSDPAKKHSDIGRVMTNKELGAQMRASDATHDDVCTVLVPMNAFKTMVAKTVTGPGK